jgi:hypothetical protein
VPELVHAPVLKEEEGHESRQPAATSSKSLARGQADSDLVTPALQAAATLTGDARARSSSLIGTECSKDDGLRFAVWDVYRLLSLRYVPGFRLDGSLCHRESSCIFSVRFGLV